MESTERRSVRFQDPEVLSRARHDAVRRCDELGRHDLCDDAALVVGELVTNAVLHGGGCTGVAIEPTEGGIRIEVRDASRLPPLMGHPTEGSLTGRGLRLVESLSARWGADAEPGGKVVWAELTGEPSHPVDHSEADILAMWDDEFDLDGDRRFHVELGDVPTDLLLSAKSHVDNLVREFALASAGESTGQTAEVPQHMRSLLRAVVDRFAEARLAIKRQALIAAGTGAPRTQLVLDLPASAAEAAEEYVRALDEIDAYCRARRMLTLETPEQHRVFRRWYVEELVASLRAEAEGRPAPRPQPFERRLLSELDRIATARRVAERSARLYSVAAALAAAATPEEVADAVVNEGVAALGAAAGGVLLAVGEDRLALSGAVGYDEAVVARLRDESPDADLPAAVALRTGAAVWLESLAERDERFPELVRLEQATVALCAVPLEVRGRRRLGALHFSFNEPRLFDEDERRFVLALAAQTAQALERTRLQQARVDVSRRLQRSLLPPRVPDVDGIEVAASYHPFGDEMDVGGDFYDIWTLQPTCWGIAIGDASGTGPEAAALTALARHTLRALTLANVDARDVLRKLNTALLDAAGAGDSDRFCTAMLGLISVDGGIQIEIVTGGHPPPLVRRADGTTEVLDVKGSLLGVFEDIDVGTVKTSLNRGDTLVAVTDGVLEARRDGKMFDVEGVKRILAESADGARSVTAALERAVLQHTGGSLTDDMAAIVLHVPESR